MRARMAPLAEQPSRGTIRVIGIAGTIEATKPEAKSVPKSPVEKTMGTMINSPIQPVSPRAEATTLPHVVTEVRIALTLQEDVWEKFRRVCDLSNHNCSPKELSAVFETLVDDYLKHHDPVQKKSRSAASAKTPPAATDEPSQSSEIENREKRQPSRRYVPQKIRRAAWQRDQGQCSYVDSTTGAKCFCRRGLQFDHIVPFAKGGSSLELSNVRVLCAAHNRLAADTEFGASFMQRKVHSAKRLRPKSRHSCSSRSSPMQKTLHGE